MIILQYMQISNHYVVRLQLMTILLNVKYTLIKKETKKTQNPPDRSTEPTAALSEAKMTSPERRASRFQSSREMAGDPLTAATTSSGWARRCPCCPQKAQMGPAAKRLPEPRRRVFQDQPRRTSDLRVRA